MQQEVTESKAASQQLHIQRMLLFFQSLSCVRLFCNPMDCSLPASSVHGILQARMNAGVGCHFLPQSIFPTQELNPCLLHLLHQKADSLLRSHLGSPYRMLDKNTELFTMNVYTMNFLYQNFHLNLLQRVKEKCICILRRFLLGHISQGKFTAPPTKLYQPE